MRGVVTTFALMAAAAGCASVGGQERRDAASGQRFVQRACAGCHATGALGALGASRNPRSPPFRTLAARLPGPALEAQLDAIARDGHVEMPPIYMTPEEVRQVAAYIRAAQARSGA